MKERLEEQLRDKASGGRLPCALAREIAESLGVPYSEVGRAANELSIKITSCELGCF
jgi:hypothetical protein